MHACEKYQQNAFYSLFNKMKFVLYVRTDLIEIWLGIPFGLTTFQLRNNYFGSYYIKSIHFTVLFFYE